MSPPTFRAVPRAPAVAFALAALALFVALAAPAAPAAAQEPDTVGAPVDSVIVTPGARPVVVPTEADTAQTGPITPRGAFIRSMIVPGWGQAAFESYFRGGIFFAGWAANWFMTFRNYGRLDDARGRLDLRTGQVRDSLIAEGFAADTIPFIIDRAVQADSAANDLDKLVRAREQQREDWIAWSIFWLLASGVDSYVTAHLSDFPGTIELEPNPDRSMTLRFEVPLPSGRP